jgi:hypothetical protein
LIINLDHDDDWIFQDDKQTLSVAGIGKGLSILGAGTFFSSDSLEENETEVSYFNRDAYDHFKANPEVNHSTVRR